jgi:hypothetical protein
VPSDSPIHFGAQEEWLCNDMADGRVEVGEQQARQLQA